jgi:hypothetical protein
MIFGSFAKISSLDWPWLTISINCE